MTLEEASVIADLVDESLVNGVDVQPGDKVIFEMPSNSRRNISVLHENLRFLSSLIAAVVALFLVSCETLDKGLEPPREKLSSMPPQYACLLGRPRGDAGDDERSVLTGAVNLDWCISSFSLLIQHHAARLRFHVI